MLQSPGNSVRCRYGGSPVQTRRAIFTVSLGLVLLGALAAHAQQVKNSTVTGTLVSANAAVSSGGAIALITAPATGHFILTQFCGSPPVGSSFGQLAGAAPPSPSPPSPPGGNPGGGCTTLSPGFALPPGEVLSCVNPPSGPAGVPPFGPPISCLVTGVLTRE